MAYVTSIILLAAIMALMLFPVVPKSDVLSGDINTGATAPGMGIKIAYADPSVSDVQAQADAVSAQLSQWQAQLNQAQANFVDAMNEHDDAQQAMDSAQATIDANQSKLAARADSMYKDGPLSFLSVLLGSSNFSEFSNNWAILNNINTQTANLISQTKQARDEYAAQEQVAADKLAEAQQISDNAQATVNQYQSELSGLNAQVAQLVQQQQAAQQAAAAQNNNNSGSNSSSGGSDDSDGMYTSGGDVPAGGYSSVVSAAYSQLGVPYVWGGTSWGSGLDCSGLTSQCYQRALGIWIGRTDADQYSNAAARLPVSEAEPGDVLWMPGHVGIYIGGGQYIHAPQPGEVVQIGSWMPMWSCALRF
jgi:cell wall-associated NlpC family hydrolase